MAAFGPENEVEFESFWTTDVQRHRQEDHDPAHVLRVADVIFAKDVMTGTKVLVWGKRFLQQKIKTIPDGVEFRYLPFVINCDFASPELRTLLMLIAVVRGRHDLDAKFLKMIGAALAGEPLDEEFDETEAA
jgi:hypothetical protein